MSQAKIKNRIDELLKLYGIESILKEKFPKGIEPIDSATDEKEKRRLSKEISLKNIQRSKILEPVLQVPDEGLITLKEHQEMVLNVFKKRRGLIVIHSTGSGKTYTGVVCSRAYLKTFPNNKVIIVAPKSLQSNFKTALINYGITDLSSYEFYTFSKFHIDRKSVV